MIRINKLLCFDFARTVLPFGFTLIIIIGEIGLFQKFDPRMSDLVSLHQAHLYVNHRGPEKLAEQRAAPPFYPLLLTAIAKIHSGLAKTLSCYQAQQFKCTERDGTALVFLIQMVCATFAGFLLFRLALLLSGNESVAWGTLILALIAGRFAEFSYLLRPEIFHYLFVFAGLLAFLKYYLSGKKAYLLIVGVSVGSVILVHSLYVVLIPLLACFILFLTPQALVKHNTGHKAAACLIFLVPAIAILLPFMLLSYQNSGDISFAYEYDRMLLAERVAFHALSNQEWWFLTVSDVPVIGEVLRSLFFEPEQIATFKKKWQNLPLPTASYQELISTHIWGDVINYIRLNLALVMRSLFAGGGVIACLGGICLISLISVLKQRRQLTPFLLIMIPLFLMLIVNSFLTLNYTHFNLPLIFVYCYAFSYIQAGV